MLYQLRGNCHWEDYKRNGFKTCSDNEFGGCDDDNEDDDDNNDDSKDAKKKKERRLLLKGSSCRDSCYLQVGCIYLQLQS